MYCSNEILILNLSTAKLSCVVSYFFQGSCPRAIESRRYYQLATYFYTLGDYVASRYDIYKKLSLVLKDYPTIETLYIAILSIVEMPPKGVLQVGPGRLYSALLGQNFALNYMNSVPKMPQSHCYLELRFKDNQLYITRS